MRMCTCLIYLRKITQPTKYTYFTPNIKILIILPFSFSFRYFDECNIVNKIFVLSFMMKFCVMKNCLTMESLMYRCFIEF